MGSLARVAGRAGGAYLTMQRSPVCAVRFRQPRGPALTASVRVDCSGHSLSPPRWDPQPGNGRKRGGKPDTNQRPGGVGRAGAPRLGAAAQGRRGAEPAGLVLLAATALADLPLMANPAGETQEQRCQQLER